MTSVKVSFLLFLLRFISQMKTKQRVANKVEIKGIESRCLMASLLRGRGGGVKGGKRSLCLIDALGEGFIAV
jgi:hypothetical protein